MKKLIKSLLAIMFLSLFTSSTLALADTKEDEGRISLESQKKDIDNLVEIGSDGAADLAKYKIDDKRLSDEQRKELLEYKSKASDELNQKIENKNKNINNFNIFIGVIIAILFIVGMVITWKEHNR